MYLKCLKKQWHGEGNNQENTSSFFMDGWVGSILMQLI